LSAWPETAQPVRSDRITSDTAARLPRQSLKQTRADLLDAGIRIVNEYVQTDQPREGDPPVDLLPFIRLDEVLVIASELARRRLVDEDELDAGARVAPLTPGAFYKAFANEYRDAGRGAALTAFHRLVTRKMVEDEIAVNVDLYISLGTALAEQGEPWSELARLGVQMECERWQTTPALVLYSALALYTRDDEVRKWTRAIEESEQHGLARMYSALLEAFGMRLRQGITVETLVIAIYDLVTGFAVNSRFVPETRRASIEIDVDGHGKQSWHPCALAAWGVYSSFVEPGTQTRLAL
jgi:hypothetical protein